MINLLPHREMRRRRRRRGFFIGIGLGAALGLLLLAGLGSLLSQQVSSQAARNALLEAGITRLDAQIRDVAGLRAEIAELEARGRAVQFLQSGRNLSVQLLEALAEHAPGGLQLLSVRQTGEVVALSGVALSSEHVATLMRDATAPGSLFGRAELIEVRAVGGGADRQAARRYEFSVRLLLRPPSASAPAASTPPGASGR